MVNAAREKWPTIVLTGSLAGADNENSMLNHDYSVSFHFSVFVVVFFLFSWLYPHTHETASTEFGLDEAKIAFNANIHKSAIVGNCVLCD